MCLGKFFLHIKAWAGLGREVVVTSYKRVGVLDFQRVDERAEGMFLCLGTGVSRLAKEVETTLVADADAVGVVA